MCLEARAQSEGTDVPKNFGTPDQPSTAMSGKLQETVTPLQIGDTIPEYLWHLPLQVVNHPEGKEAITLDDYRGKLIILDFWATYCNTCIKSLPTLDSMQHRLNSDIEIVLVNAEPTKDNIDKINVALARLHTSINLPIVFHDTVLYRHFQITGVPRYIWIDKHGAVVHITNRQGMNWDSLMDGLRDQNGGDIVSGKVISEGDGMPISGATVRLKSRPLETAVLTDSLGAFNLPYDNLRKDDSLLISHIGYGNQTYSMNAIDKRRLLTVPLTPSERILDEVVVYSGYEAIPKERATGSYIKLDGDLLAQQVYTNALDALPILGNSVSLAKRTNVTAPRIMIRGLSTLDGPKNPLIVLDNFPYEGDIENINPNDIENITVLKDAAAASIWGSRAGNGVIVITTKKAQYEQPLSITVNSNIKIMPPPDLHYFKRMSTSDIIDVEQFLFDEKYRFSDTSAREHPPFSPVYELLFARQNGQISEAALQQRLNQLRSIDVRDEYNRLFYSNGINQQYALSIANGSAHNAWQLSGGFDKNLSVLDAGFDRLSLRVINDSRLTEKLTLSTGVNFTWSRSTSGKPDIGTITQSGGGLPPYTRFMDDDGIPIPFEKDYRAAFVNEMAELHPDLLDWNYYPTEDYLHDRSTTTIQNLIGNLGINYRIFNWLNVDAKYQYQRQHTDGNTLRDANSYYARNLVNSYYQPGEESFAIPKGGVLNLSDDEVNAQSVRTQLNVDQKWGNHAIAAIAGAEVRGIYTNGKGYRQYGYDDDILVAFPVNYNVNYTSLVTGRQSLIPNSDSFTRLSNRYVSVYGNGSYRYKERYVLSLSARRDASNIFGVTTNNKWTPLWSAGLAWELSKENFYRSATLPYLKLRATYGFSGNVDPSLTAVTTIVYSNVSPYTMSSFAQVNRFYNPDLRWEKSRQVNLGVDFRTASNRISGTVEYYEKKGIDLYGPSPLDYTAGIGRPSITKNVASMRANGMDFMLQSVNTTGMLKWNTTLNASLYRDKVTSYYLRDRNGSQFVGEGTNISGIAGMPLYAIFSFKWAGLDSQTGDPLGILPDGTVSKDYNQLTGNGVSIEDLVFQGNAMPRFFGSLGNTFRWRNLSFTFYLGYKLGYYFRRPSIRYNNLFRTLDGHSDYTLRWQKPGDELHTYVPSMAYPTSAARETFYYGSEVLVGRADHIRLQYVHLAYQFSDIPGVKALKDAQLYLNANNLGILWAANKEGLDPDYTSSTAPMRTDIAIGLRLRL